MCHLVLLLPVFGIAVFWIWPIRVALLIYALILAVSAVMYKALLDAMRRPPITGLEGLLHHVGEITDMAESGWLVRIHGELWRATSPDVLKPGDAVEVTGVQGLTLHVRANHRPVPLEGRESESPRRDHA